MKLATRILSLSLVLALACGDDDGSAAVDMGTTDTSAPDTATPDMGGAATPDMGGAATRDANIATVDGSPVATTGTARIEGGMLTLNLEIAAGGPGATQVILAQSAAEIAEAAAGTFTDALGTIDSADGFSGELSFAIPAGVNADEFSYVIIWCPTAMINFGAGSFDGDTPAPSARAAAIGTVDGSPVSAAGLARLEGDTLTLNVEISAGGPGATQVILAQSAGEIADAAAGTFTDALGTIDSAGGFSGELTFTVPAGVDASEFTHVIIWCPTAGINFGAGALEDAAERTAAIGTVEGSPVATAGAVSLAGDTLTLNVEIAAGGPGATQVILAQSAGEISDAADGTFTEALGTIDSADGFSGELTFTVPAGVDASDFSHVIIWCPTAGINFGVGALN